MQPAHQGAPKLQREEKSVVGPGYLGLAPKGGER